MVRELLAHIPATIKSEPPILSGGRPFLPDLGAEADLTPLHLAAHEGNEGVVRILLNIPGVQADGTSRLNVRMTHIHATPCPLTKIFVFALEVLSLCACIYHRHLYNLPEMSVTNVYRNNYV